MSDQATITTQFSTELLARSALYRFAARCLADPLLAPFAQAADVDTAEAAAEYLNEPKLARAAARVGQTLPARKEEASAVYMGLFGMDVSSEASPYEVEFEKKTDVFFRTQRLADVAGFYRAFALDAMPGERPDHIAVEAEFLQYLLERKIAARRLNHGPEKEAILDDAFQSFFRDHFARWAPSFARRLYTIAQARDDSFYPAVALFLERLSKIEIRRSGLSESELRASQATPIPMDLSSEEGACQKCEIAENS